MHEMISPILDWISSEHGSGSRRNYGWVYVVGAIVALSGMIKARDYAAKRSLIKGRASAALVDRSLATSMIVKENGGEAKYMAKLKQEGDKICLIIVGVFEGREQEMTKKNFASFDEVEKYLVEKTGFRLADFT